ncbi:MAG: HAD hydrolase family protein [Candidatus Omnitrophota bacterium]
MSKTSLKQDWFDDTMNEAIKKIKVLVCDVDGVLTDAKITLDSRGQEIKSFDIYDGFALVLAKRVGIKTAFLTGRYSKVVNVRAKGLKIDKVYQNADPKIGAYQKLLRYFKVKDENVCFIGDDLIDLQILKRVGFAVCVANACQEAKKEADYITLRKGGEGAVREVVELILKAQGKWQKVIERYAC